MRDEPSTGTGGGASSTFNPGNRAATINGFQLSYDTDGNVQARSGTGGANYAWSAEGRLQSATAGTGGVQLDYDAFGRPVRRTTNGVVDRWYLWDKDGQLLAELNGTAAQRVSEYAYAPGLDQPVAIVTGATTIAATKFPVQDEIGNVVGVINGNAVDQSVTYNPWGKATVSGSPDNSLLWKGLLFEGGTAGLYYMRARWYDPETARFMSEDPAGLSAGINLYVFGDADPINSRDPLGLCASPLDTRTWGRCSLGWYSAGNALLREWRAGDDHWAAAQARIPRIGANGNIVFTPYAGSSWVEQAVAAANTCRNNMFSPDLCSLLWTQVARLQATRSDDGKCAWFGNKAANMLSAAKIRPFYRQLVSEDGKPANALTFFSTGRVYLSTPSAFFDGDRLYQTLAHEMYHVRYGPGSSDYWAQLDARDCLFDSR